MVSTRYRHWNELEQRKFIVGDLIDAYGGDLLSLRYLERNLWDRALRGFIRRSDFRQVVLNLRRGWSAIGDD